jgi:hypothetical protein
MSGTSFIKMLVFASSVILFSACDKECDASKAEACEVYVPANESCQTQFKRWFYDESSNSCQLVEYTGCTQRGFETQSDCQICVCD